MDWKLKCNSKCLYNFFSKINLLHCSPFVFAPSWASWVKVQVKVVGAEVRSERQVEPWGRGRLPWRRCISSMSHNSAKINALLHITDVPLFFLHLRRKEQEQLAALKQHHIDEIDHHKKEIERLQREIDRHKGKIRKLKYDDWVKHFKNNCFLLSCPGRF